MKHGKGQEGLAITALRVGVGWGMEYGRSHKVGQLRDPMDYRTRRRDGVR